MKDDQVTIRLPRELARILARRARETGVPKSQLVREALQTYLAEAPADQSESAWSRVADLVGSLSLDPAAIERDALTRQLRAHNWRE
jgi:metal-responsive CopG/Arc/MetJ family transcriptional regulator